MRTTIPTEGARTTPHPTSLSWWIRDRHGEVVVAQPPNPAILVWLVATVVGWTELLDERRDGLLAGIGRGALVVWAVDEVLRGASPARRVLGAAVGVVVLVRLFA